MDDISNAIIDIGILPNPYINCLLYAGATVLDTLTIECHWVAKVELGKEKGYIIGTIPDNGIQGDLDELGGKATIKNLTAIGDHYLDVIFTKEKALLAISDRINNGWELSGFTEFINSKS